MTDNADLLRVAATFPCDPRHKQLLLESAYEIEVLTRCLNIAAGYISATSGYTHMHPQQVADMIRNAVITGDENDD